MQFCGCMVLRILQLRICYCVDIYGFVDLCICGFLYLCIYGFMNLLMRGLADLWTCGMPANAKPPLP